MTREIINNANNLEHWFWDIHRIKNIYCTGKWTKMLSYYWINVYAGNVKRL